MEQVNCPHTHLAEWDMAAPIYVENNGRTTSEYRPVILCRQCGHTFEKYELMAAIGRQTVVQRLGRA